MRHPQYTTFDWTLHIIGAQGRVAQREAHAAIESALTAPDLDTLRRELRRANLAYLQQARCHEALQETTMNDYKDDLRPENERPAGEVPSSPYPADAQKRAEELIAAYLDGAISKEVYRASLALLVQVYQQKEQP